MKKKQKKSKKNKKFKKKVIASKSFKKTFKKKKRSSKKKFKKIKKVRSKNIKKKTFYLKSKKKSNESLIYKLVKLQLSLKPQLNLKINFSFEKYIQRFFDKMSEIITNYKILKHDEKRR